MRRPRIGLGGGSGSGNVADRIMAVSGIATGVLANIAKYLPGASWTKFSDLPGVTIATNGDASVIVAIGKGSSVAGIVTGTLGSKIVQYGVTLQGAMTVPDQIGTVTATAGNGQVALAWSPPANGGSAITDYRGRYKPSASSVWMPISDAVSATTGMTATGLTNGVAYDFDVVAVNAVGACLTPSVAVSATPNEAVYDYPAVFTSGALNAMPVRLVKNPDGGFTHDFNEASWKQPTTMYVRSYGNDANGGTNSTTDAKATYQNIMDNYDLIHIDSMEAGAIFAPYSCPTGKKFSIEGHPTTATWCGERITSAQVASITLSAAGRYTVTLNTGGSVSGFIDRRGKDVWGGCHTSYSAVTAAEIGTLFQANNDAGIFRATNSVLGLYDGAVIDAARIDNDLILFSATSAAPETLGGTAQVFTKNINHFGGVVAVTPIGSKRIRVGGGSYGAVVEGLRCGGWSFLLGNGAGDANAYQVRGCRVAGSDAVDYEQDMANVRFFEYNITARGAGTGLADNASTCHGGAGIRLDSRYVGGCRVVHDTGSMIAMENCDIYFDYMAAGSFHLGNGRDSEEGGSTYFRKIRTYGTPTSTGQPPTNGNFYVASAGTMQCRMYCLDNSIAGKVARNTAGADAIAINWVVDLSGSKPTGNTVLFSWDAADTGTLYQTADLTQPVTSAGQSVGRIEIGFGAYLLCTGVTYQNGGGLHWYVLTDTSKMLLRNTPPLWMEDDLHLLLTADANDPVALPIGGSSGFWIDARPGTGLAYRMPAPAAFPMPTYMADKSAIANGVNAQQGALKTALYSGGVKTLTMKHYSQAWDGTRTLGIASTPSNGGGFDGKVYGGRIIRADDAFLALNQSASALRGGAVI